MDRKIKVLKFGGQMLSTDLNIVQSQWRTILSEINRILDDVKSNNLVWMVMSATLETTRKLDGVASHLLKGNYDLAWEELHKILLAHKEAGIALTKNHHSDVNSAFTRLQSVVKVIFEEITDKGFEPNGFLHAAILSLGERMTVELMVIPALNDLRPSLYTAHESALDLMRAHVDRNLATIARLDVPESARLIRGRLDQLISFSEGKEEVVPFPRIFAMEGYIASGQGGRYVVLGYDTSDLSAVVSAHALSAKEVVLIKNIDTSLSIPVLLPELLIAMRRVRGDKARIVGIPAIECAMEFNITIVLRDPVKGFEQRITPHVLEEEGVPSDK